MKFASLILMFVLLISLIMDWSDLYYSPGATIMNIIFNKAFITSFCVAIALFMYYRLMDKEADTYYLPGVENKLVRTAILTIGIFVLYLGGLFETHHQFATRGVDENLYVPFVFLYTAAFAVMLTITLKQIQRFSVSLLLGITLLCFLFYCSGIDKSNRLFIDLALNKKNSLPVLAHWLGVILLFWLMYKAVQAIRKNITNSRSLNTSTYVIAFAFMIVISFSLMYPWLLLNNVQGAFHYYINLYEKAVLSITWGLSSFAMMWLGFKKSFKPLRWCSIILFAVTLLKLFLYDIRDIPPGGKIAAFILLGVLLLTISFMYQRLKKLIIDDDKKTE